MSNETDHECPVCGAAVPADELEGDGDHIACPECGERSTADDWEG